MRGMSQKELETLEYLETFFEEKEIESRVFPVEHEGVLHMVQSSTVIDWIINNTAPEHQEVIAYNLRMIDFRNGNVNHFLQYLAKGYIQVFY